MARSTRPALRLERVYTTEGVHPYDEITWEHRDVEMRNWRDNTVNFEQRGVEFPASWSVNASNIVVTKYFRGAVNTPEREYSLKQVIDRIANTYTAAGLEHGYFVDEAQAEIFKHELIWMLVNQHFAFNSPVWFNVGTASPQQVSACFILAVEDTMDDILEWYKEEGRIFKGGSGAGLNLSKIRSSKELLSSGGTASGPVSFMRGADASAGTIKSGGATRRAAKMVVLDVDHPDIEEFVELKSREEEKIRVLRDAGFDMDLGGKDITSVQYQNANNSVRVNDKFMRAVEAGGQFDLLARKDGSVIDTVDARKLWRQIAEAAWSCADPGVQYDDTIQDWHTTPETGRITASNPCSEFLSNDNSSCNLSSLRLTRYLRDDDTFDVEKFVKSVELIITAMDISICFADFPTEKITNVTRDYRQLGIGYSDAGALLLASGHAYDSEGGRALLAGITSLMTAAAYKRSAELAEIVGPYAGYAQNASAHKRVIRKHAAANDTVRPVSADDKRILDVAASVWESAISLGEKHGFRNAQASLLAPTGTISFMMDCDTTGIEPDFALVKHKKLVGGGEMDIVNATVPRALRKLGYDESTTQAIVAHVADTGHVVGAPGLAAEHYEVFDCAMGDERYIKPMGHVRMMAACQPFLSGAISKTVNLPQDTTVEEIEEIHFAAWKMNIKALAVYRDNCKVGQPLSGKKKLAEAVEAAENPSQIPVEARPVRKRLPLQRRETATSFSVQGVEGYIRTGEYPGDGIGELFIDVSKQGSTLAGIFDALSISVSLGLQSGVPLEAYCRKFINMRFEPNGMTEDKDIRIATSIIDYIFRRIALDYLSPEQREELGVKSSVERAAELDASYGAAPAAVAPAPAVAEAEATVVEEQRATRGFKLEPPLCTTCGVAMERSGSCWACRCGLTSGCS